MDIFSTLNQELAEKFIDHAIKERNKQKVTQESKIEISVEIMDQINKKHFYSRQKGRALSMLVSSREIYKVNRKRKRKREYKPYELSKEEMKNYKQKRSKPMNFNEENEEEIKLSKELEEEYMNEMERIEREMNENDENDMNIDRKKD